MLAIIVLARLAVFSSAENRFLVYPTILQERTTASNFVLQLTDDIILNLKKSDVLATKLLMTTSREEGSQTEEEGIVNSNLRIKPLLMANRTLRGKMLHLLYEVQEKTESFINFGSGRIWRHIFRQKAHVETFVVELHIVSDKEHQKYFKTKEDLISYMAVMTNAVNLRYLDMTKPKIKFMLVGVTRSMEDGFAKIIDGAIIGAETLDGLVKYYKEGRISGAPDMVHLITGRDMARYENGVLDRSYNGVSKQDTVCTKYAVGLSEDTATSFLGVAVMAHELAHVLGAEHDDPPKCPWSEGYLMSYLDGGVKKYRLSSCTVEEIRNAVKKLPWHCTIIVALTNYMSRHKALPGQIVNEEHYCRKYLKVDDEQENVYSVKSERSARKCKMDCCHSPSYRIKLCLEANIPDGMECFKGETCQRGVCGNHTYIQH
ncbi:venom metalloproteinase antarease TserMP_A-like isoform X2 [Dermacentor variabilis]|uniref:venom metalloproteinase antarease TserMP_A-like isoform X2 n=1 Tax=Dermacentor variabilis TaxID=34621 RepID=UPI003F5C8C9C